MLTQQGVAPGRDHRTGKRVSPNQSDDSVKRWSQWGSVKTKAQELARKITKEAIHTATFVEGPGAISGMLKSGLIGRRAGGGTRMQEGGGPGMREVTQGVGGGNRAQRV